MCGIAGQIAHDKNRDTLHAELARMCDAIVHRGPDDHGYHVDEHAPVAIGMRRLSIIDLEGGKQPFYSEDGKVVAVCNGEIYNFVPLRQQLEAKGHTFRSRSDCETVVHAYEEWGEAFLDHLEGMFGIALYDIRQRRMLLVRDRFGIKPVYYFSDTNRFAFGSEIKSILEVPEVLRRIDPRALRHYLWNASVPDPLTLFDGIRKLPPGHLLRYDIASKSLEVKRYWRFEVGTAKDSVATVEEMEGQLRQTICDHLQSDVPVGVLLSGGVDSSAVTALASQEYNQPLHTFSIAFDIPGYSEFEYSQAVAERYQTQHHTEVISAQQYASLVDKVIWNMDEPVCDPAMPAMFRVCEFARDHVKVLLSGEGADELLGGYAGRLNGARVRMSPAGRFKTLLHSTREPKLKRLLSTIAAMPDALSLPDCVWMLRAEKHGWDPKDINRLLGDSNGTQPWRDWVDDPAMRDRWHCEATELMDRLLYLDTNVNLPGTLLMKADKMSMGASIELRVPFLGDRFARYSAHLPFNAKVDGDNGKALLKKTLEPYLSHELLYRRKRGWPVPIGEWIRKDLNGFAKGILFDTAGDSILQRSELEHFWNIHQSGKVNIGLRLWQLLLLRLWQHTFKVSI